MPKMVSLNFVLMVSTDLSLVEVFDGIDHGADKGVQDTCEQFPLDSLIIPTETNKRIQFN